MLRLWNSVDHPPVGGEAFEKPEGLSEPPKGLAVSVLRRVLPLNPVECRRRLLELLGVGVHSFYPSVVCTGLALKIGG